MRFYGEFRINRSNMLWFRKDRSNLTHFSIGSLSPAPNILYDSHTHKQSLILLDLSLIFVYMIMILTVKLISISMKYFQSDLSLFILILKFIFIVCLNCLHYISSLFILLSILISICCIGFSCFTKNFIHQEGIC